MADDPEADNGDVHNGAPPLPVQESIYNFVVKVKFFNHILNLPNSITA